MNISFFSLFVGQAIDSDCARGCYFSYFMAVVSELAYPVISTDKASFGQWVRSVVTGSLEALSRCIEPVFYRMVKIPDDALDGFW